MPEMCLFVPAGNIAQGDVCRALIGDRGGVEALFLILEDKDETVCANTLWALCNLMWHPPNQAHAGRFIPDIFAFFKHPYFPIKSNAVILMANVLYYNNPNRIRFLETDHAIETLLEFVKNGQAHAHTPQAEPPVVEASLRALLSLSYVDFVAMWLGNEAHAIPLLITYLSPPYLTRHCMVYALEIICNLCVHHSNRLLILNGGGIDALVPLHADDDLHVQRLSVSVIEYLEDVTPVEVLARKKAELGLERAVVLATSDDPLVRTIAAETIGEEIWHNAEKQKKAGEIGGVDALLAIVKNESEEGFTVLPALWSLRNCMHNENVDTQSQFGSRDGVFVVVHVLARAVSGMYGEHTEHILEAGLACLVSAIMNNQANSYRLLIVGLDAMMDLADKRVPELPPSLLASTNPNSLIDGKYNAVVYYAMQSEAVIKLAQAILLMLGPFNFIVCRNCHRKQELLGQCCMHCGHKLRVDVVDKKDSLSFKKAAVNYASKASSTNGAGASGAGGGAGGGVLQTAGRSAMHAPHRAMNSPPVDDSNNQNKNSHNQHGQIMLSASVPNLKIHEESTKDSSTNNNNSLLSQTQPIPNVGGGVGGGSGGPGSVAMKMNRKDKMVTIVDGGGAAPGMRSSTS
jgi:hypothetical protein